MQPGVHRIRAQQQDKGQITRVYQKAAAPMRSKPGEKSGLLLGNPAHDPLQQRLKWGQEDGGNGRPFWLAAPSGNK